MNIDQRKGPLFQIFNFNLYFLFSFFFFLLFFLSFFLIIKYSNSSHNLITKKIPKLNQEIFSIENAINAEKSKMEGKLSNIKSRAIDFGMYKADTDQDIVKWLE